jgi:hypothetical protein
MGVAQSNHKMMCKFDDRNSQKYKPVWVAIKALAEAALAAPANSVSEIIQTNGEAVHLKLTRLGQFFNLSPLVESIKPIFSVPFPRDKQFVQRKPIFSQIDTGLRDDRPVSLCGIGGIGYEISEPPV